ncbi:MAG: hypothetical protein A3K18_13515 [Lentisphaerae bacterium RIFOXYA12_64_32]|nr:MAG: hypothetical protein A3K18_13515 [Lentisphaerae bacterium RIFOXYA12_64_32]
MSYTPPTLAIVAVTKTADGLYRAKSANHKHELRSDPRASTDRTRILTDFGAPFQRLIRHIDEIYAARQRNEARRIREIAANRVDGVWFSGMRDRWGGCGKRPRSICNTTAAC